MGSSKLPLYAYVDEAGNTGHNLFDVAQPDFYTAALITKGDFDLAFTGSMRAIADKLGAQSLHGKELGIARLESVAEDILRVLCAAKAIFFVSRVEKRYLLGTKVFDMIFDSGENAAVAWHDYNFRFLKIPLAFKVSYCLDEDTARMFWQCILEPVEAKAYSMLPEICARLLANLNRLPDERSRQILGDGLEWARTHPESLQIHIDRKSARQGHFPNMVAFANLLQGLEDHSQRVKRPVARITHDEQNEFQKTLTAWHNMYSHMPPDEITWAGETYSMQRVVGSTFEVKADDACAGLQMTDIVLWLYHSFRKGKYLPRGCESILDYVFKNGWENDFSFEGVEKMLLENYPEIFGNSPMAPSDMEKAKELLDKFEEERQRSMAQYEKDRIPPFMRRKSPPPEPDLMSQSVNAVEAPVSKDV